MSDANRVQILTLEESTWGTTPASAGTIGAYVSSKTGGLVQGFNASTALVTDQNAKDQRQSTTTQDVTFGGEYAYGDIFEKYWLEGLFRKDRTAPATITATDISFTAPGTIATVAGDFTIFPAYSWVRIAGTASNNTEVFVTSVSTLSMTTAAWTPVVSEIAGASMTIDNDGHLTDSTTVKFYSNEVDSQSLTTYRYQTFPGAVPVNATLDITGGQSFINYTCQFQGKPASVPTSASAYTGAATAATTNTQFNPGTGLSAIFIDDAAAAACTVNSLQIGFPSPVELSNALGGSSLAPCRVRGNRRAWTITMDVLADDAGLAWYAKRHTNALMSLAFRLVDAEGNIQRWYIPEIRLTGGDPDVSGVDTTITVPLAGTIVPAATEGYIMAIDNFAA